MSWQPRGPALLFVPGDRPDRYAKAAERADVVILDLEDAVAPADKPAARAAVVASRLDPAYTMVRVNPVGTADFTADLAALAETDYRVVMLAKTESAAQLTEIDREVVALIETPLGVIRAVEIAATENCIGLMWGAEDLVAAMGGSQSRFTAREVGRAADSYRDAPRFARAQVALAAAAYGRFAIDAVHLDIADEAGLRAEALDAVALGYAGTACIHPSQVAIVRQAYAPTTDQIDWAARVLAAATDEAGVFAFEGRMVDGPVLTQARAIIRRTPR